MKPWTAAIAAAWLILFGVSFWRDARPATWWFRPSVPVFHDTVQGVCAEWEWKREIRRPFKGMWAATLQRQHGTGGFGYYRRFTGHAPYEPDAALPDVPERTLRWWFDLGDLPCDWPPGVYRIVTVWTVYPATGDPRRVTRVSAPFEIHPAVTP